MARAREALVEAEARIETEVPAIVEAGGAFAMRVQRQFEVGCWDVIIEAQATQPGQFVWWTERVAIELKPALGDDYPAVLRQMKANRYGPRTEYGFRADGYVLVFDRFTATGYAAQEQVRAIFATRARRWWR